MWRRRRPSRCRCTSARATGLMKDLGYGQGYQYAHDARDARVDQEPLPESLRGAATYDHRPRARPSRTPLEAWRRWRAEQRRPT